MPINSGFEQMNVKSTTPFTLGNALEEQILDFKINGTTSQFTQEIGKNICPTDFSYWESGQYTLENGEKTVHTARVRLKKLLLIDRGQSYFVKVFWKNIPAQPRFALRTYDKNQNFLRSLGGIDNGSIIKLNNDEWFLGVTLWGDDTPTNFSIDKWEQYFNNGDVQPFICLSTVQNKDFEEYIPQIPSPENKSNVITTKGDYSIKKSNQNMFDIMNWLNNDFGIVHGTLINKDLNGITLQATDRDCYTNTYYKDDILAKHKIEQFGNEIKPNTEYSFIMKKDTTAISRNMVFFYDENYTYLSGIDSYSDTMYHIMNFTTPSNAKYMTTRFGILNAGDEITFSDIMVLEGNYTIDNLPDYKQNENQIYDIVFGNIELCNKDKIYKENGKWYLEKRIWKLVLTGSEFGWRMDERTSPQDYKRVIFDLNTLNPMYYHKKDPTVIEDVYCNLFLPTPAFAAHPTYQNKIRFGNTDNQFNQKALFYPEYDLIKDLDTWNNFVSQNNIELYYPLQNPIITEIVDKNLVRELDRILSMHLYEGTNIISSDGPIELEIRYLLNQRNLGVDLDQYVHLNLHRNELKDAVIHSLYEPPTSPKIGQIYYNINRNKMFYWNGHVWVDSIDEIVYDAYLEDENNYRLDNIAFDLEVGTHLFIRFDKENEIAGANLNVLNTGFKPIFQYGNSLIPVHAIQDGIILEVYYDGENYTLVGGIENQVEEVIISHEPPPKDPQTDLWVDLDDSVNPEDYGIVVDAHYVHTDNNFNDDAKAKLEGIEDGAQVNRIENISVNGNSLPINNKSVDIPIPTKTSQLINDSTYQTKEELDTAIESVVDEMPIVLYGTDVDTIQEAINYHMKGKNILIYETDATNKVAVIYSFPSTSVPINSLYKIYGSYLREYKQTIDGAYSNHYIYAQSLSVKVDRNNKIISVAKNLERYSNQVQYLDTQINYSSPYMPKFAGSPATKQYVDNSINTAISQISLLHFEIVDTLPTVGEDNVIYLVKNSSEDVNQYDEYIYINGKWEPFGPEIDLTGYVKDTDLVPVSHDEIKAMIDGLDL